jgi:hypothetical protein
VAFTIDDIKIVLGAPAISGYSTNGNFHVTLLSQLGTIGVPVGSGYLTMTLTDGPDANVEVFDFSGLSISLTAGAEYYLQVAGPKSELEHQHSFPRHPWNDRAAAPLRPVPTLAVLELEQPEYLRQIQRNVCHADLRRPRQYARTIQPDTLRHWSSLDHLCKVPTGGPHLNRRMLYGEYG